MPKNDSTRKMKDFDTQKLSKNVGDSDKLNVAKGSETLPKVQNFTQSGHTGCDSVGRVFASDTRGPVIGEFLLITFICC